MAGDPITQFDPDPTKLAVLQQCIDNYGVGDPDAEWPNNIISRRAVVYGSGVIARRGDPIRHAVDPDELALSRRLSAQVARLMAGVDVGMGSEAGDPFHEFFVAGNVDEPPPTVIDEGLIRARFGGTLFPLVTITVEPLAEDGVWWDEVTADAGGSKPDYLRDCLRPWRTMIRWFRKRPEFVDTAFIRIGDFQKLLNLPRRRWPAGTESTGCVFPRLALGLTKGGSLVGLFGHSVQT